MTSFTSLSALSMGIDDFIGTPVQQEGGFFDPLNLSDGKDEDTLRWYRAAELKHGRVCMLATLGVVVQGLGASLPNPIFQETNAFKAVGAIYEASLLSGRSSSPLVLSRSSAPPSSPSSSAPATSDGTLLTLDLRMRPS